MLNEVMISCDGKRLVKIIIINNDCDETLDIYIYIYRVVGDYNGGFQW